MRLYHTVMSPKRQNDKQCRPWSDSAYLSKNLGSLWQSKQDKTCHYASSEGSGEPEHPRSLARTFAARKQAESQIPGPSHYFSRSPFRGARDLAFCLKFLLTHCLYGRAAKVLARLRGCAGSPEPSLLAQAISTKFAWRGPKEKW